MRRTPALPIVDSPFRADLARWFTGFFSSFLVVALVPRFMGLFARKTAGRLFLEAAVFLLVGILFERGGRSRG